MYRYYFLQGARLIHTLSKIIYTESPEKAIWRELSYFENEFFSRQYLKECYQRLSIPYPERAAFRNVTPFMIYIRQARNIFLSLDNSSLWMEPVQLYYGMMSLLKACILTMDPDYPRSTSVLRHGISTKKRKKEVFRFLLDEIRIQKDGLFPFYQRLFSIPCRKDYTPFQLLHFLPDIKETIQTFTGKSYFIPVDLTSSPSKDVMVFSLSVEVLDRLHISLEAFVDFLNRTGKEVAFGLTTQPKKGSKIELSWKPDHPSIQHVDNWKYGFNHPYFYENKKGDHFFWIRNDHQDSPLPEMEAQYLLLFALSMLCRYEPPLWAEVMDINASTEGIMIQELLQLVRRKFPNFILNQLRNEKLIFLIR